MSSAREKVVRIAGLIAGSGFAIATTAIGFLSWPSWAWWLALGLAICSFAVAAAGYLWPGKPKEPEPVVPQKRETVSFRNPGGRTTLRNVASEADVVVDGGGGEIDAKKIKHKPKE